MLPDASVYTHSPLGDDEVPREFFTAQFYHCKHLAVRVRGGGDGRWVMVGGWVSLTVGLGRLLTRATLIYHKELLTKPPVLKGNVYITIYTRAHMFGT